MKKGLIALLVILCILMPVFAGGGGQAGRGAQGPFPGRIAIVTSALDQNEEEFRSAEQLIRKYGADKIIHVSWPTNFMAEQEQLITILTRIAADMEVRGLVINQSVPGSIAAIDRFKALRDDVFIFTASPQENPPDVSRRADLAINQNQFAIGSAYVDQAHALGATTIIHYSFPRHMSQVLLSGRRDRMLQRANELGIRFVDVTAPDPTGEAGLPGTQQFILEDVPKQIATYGTQTAFFGTNCGMQIPLLRRVFEGRAIYPQPCDPSPYHAYPAALGIQTYASENVLNTLRYVVEETRRIAAGNDMTGRLSNWPVSSPIMFTHLGVEYIIRYLNGETSKSPNHALLAQLTREHIQEASGVEVEFTWTPYEEAGVTYNNYMLMRMGFITY